MGRLLSIYTVHVEVDAAAPALRQEALAAPIGLGPVAASAAAVAPLAVSSALRPTAKQGVSPRGTLRSVRGRPDAHQLASTNTPTEARRNAPLGNQE